MSASLDFDESEPGNSSFMSSENWIATAILMSTVLAYASFAFGYVSGRTEPGTSQNLLTFGMILTLVASYYCMWLGTRQQIKASFRRWQMNRNIRQHNYKVHHARLFRRF